MHQIGHTLGGHGVEHQTRRPHVVRLERLSVQPADLGVELDHCVGAL